MKLVRIIDGAGPAPKRLASEEHFLRAAIERFAPGGSVSTEFCSAATVPKFVELARGDVDLLVLSSHGGYGIGNQWGLQVGKTFHTPADLFEDGSSVLARSVLVLACDNGPRREFVDAVHSSTSWAFLSGPERLVVTGIGSITQGHMSAGLGRSAAVIQADPGRWSADRQWIQWKENSKGPKANGFFLRSSE